MDGGYASRKRKPESFRDQSFRELDFPDKNKRKNIDNDVDTLYRMLCPVHKIGSVLGKGGNIVSAIRDETHAKIRVADRIPGADERVVFIYDHPISEPAGQDHDSDVNAVKEGQYKPHCPAQGALLKIYDRIVEDDFLEKGDSHKNSEADEVTVRLLVPTNQVGCLIGKAGDVIHKLRNETRANIRIQGGEHLPPSAMMSDELVQISGKSDVVKKALYEISTRLYQHPRKENPPVDEIIAASSHGFYPPGVSIDPVLPHRNPVWLQEEFAPHAAPPSSFLGSYRNDPSWRVDDHDVAEDFSLKVVCLTGKVGGVIGKGGANIRRLEQQTGAKIHVGDSSSESEVRIIEISAKEAMFDCISPTTEAILLLQEKVSELSDSGAITTRLLVPSSKAGCLLGQGGQVINEMRRRTKADIRVYAKADKPSYASINEELVQVSGSQRCAREALLEVVSRLRERTLRDGNAAAHHPPAGLSRGFSPYDSLSGVSRAPSAAGYGHPDTKGFESKFEDDIYAAPPHVSRYSDIYNSVEARYPSSAASVYRSGVDGTSDIREEYGTRAKLYDPPPRYGEYASDSYGRSELTRGSWSHQGSYTDQRREDPWHSTLPHRAFGRD